MIYCYVCTVCGKKSEKQLPMSESATEFTCECGKPMRRDFRAECGTFKDTPGNWPMESDAAGVSPDQIPEAMAYNERMGVPTRYNPETGAAIFTSREHRKRFCEISGLYDRNGGYGDQAPRNNMRRRHVRQRSPL